MNPNNSGAFKNAKEFPTRLSNFDHRQLVFFSQKGAKSQIGAELITARLQRIWRPRMTSLEGTS